jgi:hypothetical protein
MAADEAAGILPWDESDEALAKKLRYYKIKRLEKKEISA